MKLELGKVEGIGKDCLIVHNGFKVFGPEVFCSTTLRELGDNLLLIFIFLDFLK
jgi:hypothetical protein